MNKPSQWGWLMKMVTDRQCRKALGKHLRQSCWGWGKKALRNLAMFGAAAGLVTLVFGAFLAMGSALTVYASKPQLARIEVSKEQADLIQAAGRGKLWKKFDHVDEAIDHERKQNPSGPWMIVLGGSDLERLKKMAVEGASAKMDANEAQTRAVRELARQALSGASWEEASKALREAMKAPSEARLWTQLGGRVDGAARERAGVWETFLAEVASDRGPREGALNAEVGAEPLGNGLLCLVVLLVAIVGARIAIDSLKAKAAALVEAHKDRLASQEEAAHLARSCQEAREQGSG